MSHNISYDGACILQNTLAVIPTTLTTSEADLFIAKDNKYLSKSQLSVYLSVTLGAVVSATFNYYFSPDRGVTWYPYVLYNPTNGEVPQRTLVIDAASYSTGGVSSCVDGVAFEAALAFKVTGKSNSGTPAYSVQVLGRDN